VLLWWGVIPQLGIVSDDLRLGLREVRSSTELRWPPAKNVRVGHPGAGAMNLLPRYMADARAVRCVGDAAIGGRWMQSNGVVARRAYAMGSPTVPTQGGSVGYGR